MRPVHKAYKLATFMCRSSRNPGSLILLEPKRPVQACAGKALSFFEVICYSFLYIISYKVIILLADYSQITCIHISKF